VKIPRQGREPKAESQKFNGDEVMVLVKERWTEVTGAQHLIDLVGFHTYYAYYNSMGIKYTMKTNIHMSKHL
jgi:hypothetical protein